MVAIKVGETIIIMQQLSSLFFYFKCLFILIWKVIVIFCFYLLEWYFNSSAI